MTDEENKQMLIDRYVMLLRIKADEKGENPTLDTEILITKIKLAFYSIDLELIEKSILKQNIN